jgi:hypothetical protein
MQGEVAMLAEQKWVPVCQPVSVDLVSGPPQATSHALLVDHAGVEGAAGVGGEGGGVSLLCPCCVCVWL